MRVVARAGRGVAARHDVPHVEAAPGQAGEVGAVVEGEVCWGGDVVGRAGVLLVLGVALGAVFLLAGFFACFFGLDKGFGGGKFVGERKKGDVRNLRWAMRFWMRRRSSGSVTSVQSSVFFLEEEEEDEGEEDLSFLDMEEDGECLETRDDMLGCSVSVSEPDDGLVVVMMGLLALRFPERVCRGVDEYPLLCPAWSSQSSCASYASWTSM